MSCMSVTLRPIRAGAEPFLYDVYAGTRLQELGPLGWSAEQRHADRDRHAECSRPSLLQPQGRQDRHLECGGRQRALERFRRWHASAVVRSRTEDERRRTN